MTALRRLAKPMSERVAGRVSRWGQPLPPPPPPPPQDSGAELSAASTTASSSEPESGRTVIGMVRQWNSKITSPAYQEESEGLQPRSRSVLRRQETTSSQRR